MPTNLGFRRPLIEMSGNVYPRETWSDFTESTDISAVAVTELSLRAGGGGGGGYLRVTPSGSWWPGERGDPGEIIDIGEVVMTGEALPLIVGSGGSPGDDLDGLPDGGFGSSDPGDPGEDSTFLGNTASGGDGGLGEFYNGGSGSIVGRNPQPVPVTNPGGGIFGRGGWGGRYQQPSSLKPGVDGVFQVRFID